MLACCLGHGIFLYMERHPNNRKVKYAFEQSTIFDLAPSLLYCMLLLLSCDKKGSLYRSYILQLPCHTLCCLYYLSTDLHWMAL